MQLDLFDTMPAPKPPAAPYRLLEGVSVQIELIPRRSYGSGRLDRVIRRPRRLLPALGGPSWSRLCPVCGACVLAVPVQSRTLGVRRG